MQNSIQQTSKAYPVLEKYHILHQTLKSYGISTSHGTSPHSITLTRWSFAALTQIKHCRGCIKLCSYIFTKLSRFPYSRGSPPHSLFWLKSLHCQDQPTPSQAPKWVIQLKQYLARGPWLVQQMNTLNLQRPEGHKLADPKRKLPSYAVLLHQSAKQEQLHWCSRPNVHLEQSDGKSRSVRILWAWTRSLTKFRGRCISEARLEEVRQSCS